ncbi:MAG: allantoinase AllB [Dehalobacterium sp.]
MQWEHVVKNGILVDGERTYPGNIYIKNEKIAAITQDELPGDTLEVTDARGCYVFPGFIDIHVHSREGSLGTSPKEDFYHASMAAAIGGLTTIFDMPNINPPISNVENLKNQVENFTPKAFVDFALWGICLGRLNMDEIEQLSRAGAIAFKFFWGYAIDPQNFQLVYNYHPSMEHLIPPLDEGEIYKVFQKVAQTGKVLAIHAENFALIQTLTQEVEKSGEKGYEAFLKGRPNLAEETTIQTGISFAKEVGTRLHILHVTTKEGVGLIREARAKGYPVTGETCPHYLYLCDEDFPRLGSLMKVYPPIRRREDQEMLWQGLQDGVLSVLSSDHAPHTEEEKALDLWQAPAGITGVETMLPLMLDSVNKGKLTVNQLARILSEHPARIFGLYPEKGSLEVGTDADLTIVDLRLKTRIKKEKLHSKTKVTPYGGMELQGAPVQTIVRGITVAKNGEIVGTPGGKFIHP